MKNKFEYHKFKVGNKEIESNLPKGILNKKDVRQIEILVEKQRKKIDKNKKGTINNDRRNLKRE